MQVKCWCERRVLQRQIKGKQVPRHRDNPTARQGHPRARTTNLKPEGAAQIDTIQTVHHEMLNKQAALRRRRPACTQHTLPTTPTHPWHAPSLRRTLANAQAHRPAHAAPAPGPRVQAVCSPTCIDAGTRGGTHACIAARTTRPGQGAPSGPGQYYGAYGACKRAICMSALTESLDTPL